MLFLFIFAYSFVLAEPTPAELATQAEIALQQGNFDSAVTLYQQASNKDQNNTEYRKASTIIKNVILFRKNLPTETNIQRWTSMSLSLRTFYLEHHINSETYAISKQIYTKHPNLVAASWLVESQILTQRYTEANEFLATIKQPNTILMAMQGIVYVKIDQTDQALKIADQLLMISGVSPGFCYYAGMLEALLKRNSAAVAHLVHGCQATVPSRLAMYKDMIYKNTEFQELQKSPEFSEVINAKSVTLESSCSGGSNCGNCPNRNKCGNE